MAEGLTDSEFIIFTTTQMTFSGRLYTYCSHSCSCLMKKWAIKKSASKSCPKFCQFAITLSGIQASQVALVVKSHPANAGDIRDLSSIPGLGSSPGWEHGNPLQYSCLENPMDRRAWRSIVHRVAKSQTQLKWLSVCVHSIHWTLIQILYRYAWHDTDMYRAVKAFLKML